jgi:hypothetical protein
MPISKITTGLILEEDFENYSGWDDHWVDSSGLRSWSNPAGEDGNCFYVQLTAYANGGGTASKSKSMNLGYGSRFFKLWHKCDGPVGVPYSSYYTALAIGGYYLFGQDHNAPHDWQIHTLTLGPAAGNEGVQTVTACAISAATGVGCYFYEYLDHLVITTNQYLRVTGLRTGQKVEVYNAGGSKIAEGTCSNNINVDIDLINIEYPLSCYLKLYATNGTTLIEQTTAYTMCAGDEWGWTTSAGTLTISVDVPIFYRQDAIVAAPKTCNATANLKTLAGVNYPGVTVYFTSAIGTITASDTTDANGNAHAALTSTVHGLAVIGAQWLGDAAVPACSIYINTHCFYEAEAPDTLKGYQFYCEGIEYAFTAGRYSRNELGDPNDFEVEIPEWLSTVTPNGFVNIYRKGVKEFHGLLKQIERSLSDAPQVLLKGPDIASLLDDRIVDIRLYSGNTAQYIINELLTLFPCGVSVGTLGICASPLTITIDTESLRNAIQRICDMVGWVYRVNLDRTFDFAESFTFGTAPAEFEEGVNIVNVTNDLNYAPIANWIRMRGSEALVSTKQDGTKIQQQGFHQAPSFNRSISDQSTLDTACQALLDMKVLEEQTISLNAVDTYDPGTFGPEDYVTVTAPSVGLSGLYPIKKIQRDMTDPTYVEMDLVNRTKSWYDLDKAYKRMIKDASLS